VPNLKQSAGYRVNDRLCSTCIFSSKSPVSAERFQELKTHWETHGVVQQCHHSTMQGNDVGCRGYYEAAKRGEIQNDPVSAVGKSLGWDSTMAQQEMFTVFERLRFILFVHVPEHKV